MARTKQTARKSTKGTASLLEDAIITPYEMSPDASEDGELSAEKRNDEKTKTKALKDEKRKAKKRKTDEAVGTNKTEAKTRAIVAAETSGVLFNWDPANLNAFITAANRVDFAQTPPPVWLRTKPPHMTTDSFMDDVISHLQPVAGGRVGRVLLPSNSTVQFAAICLRLGLVQENDFLQAAARAAFPVVGESQYLAEIYALATTHEANRIRMEAMDKNHEPVRALFH